MLFALFAIIAAFVIALSTDFIYITQFWHAFIPTLVIYVIIYGLTCIGIERAAKKKYQNKSKSGSDRYLLNDNDFL